MQTRECIGTWRLIHQTSQHKVAQLSQNHKKQTHDTPQRLNQVPDLFLNSILETHQANDHLNSTTHENTNITQIQLNPNSHAHITLNTRTIEKPKNKSKNQVRELTDL